MARKSRVEAWASTPLLNYLFNFSKQEADLILKQTMDLHTARRNFKFDGKTLSCVEYAKECLGKQDYTWSGEYRNWVWERGDWRLFVNNTQGFCFELKEGLTKAQVIAAWDDCRARLGVNCPFPPGTRVLVYTSEEPGVSEGYDPRYPACVMVRYDNGKSTTTGIDNIVLDNGDRLIPKRVADRLVMRGWTVSHPHALFTECVKDGIQVILSSEAVSAMSAHTAWTAMNTWKQIRERQFVGMPGNAMGNTPSAAEQEAIEIILEEANKPPTWE